jgi:hypothetical protein
VLLSVLGENQHVIFGRQWRNSRSNPLITCCMLQQHKLHGLGGKALNPMNHRLTIGPTVIETAFEALSTALKLQRANASVFEYVGKPLFP